MPVEMRPSYEPHPVFERFEDEAINDALLKQAAHLFSENYGIWGPMAQVRMGEFAKQGNRVRMSARVLREQCLPVTGRNIYVRVMLGKQLAGHVIANRWTFEGEKICWISQLVVKRGFRRRGLATKLLHSLRDGEGDSKVGILSSHPAAIRATLRAVDRSLDEVDLALIRHHARGILSSAPIGYVRNAAPYGSLFEDVDNDTVSSAYTAFYVDHQEPDEALTKIREQGKLWPFGKLAEGHEFLLIVTI